MFRRGCDSRAETRNAAIERTGTPCRQTMRILRSRKSLNARHTVPHSADAGALRGSDNEIQVEEDKIMKVFSANLDNLRKLYVNQLQMLLSAEKQVSEALPTMINEATDIQLRQAFQSHLQETSEQVMRLDQILNATTVESKEVKCKVMDALVTEMENMVKDAADDDVRNAALIAAARRVEHFEIACYGAVRHWAQILGEKGHAVLLDKTIQEEGHADKLLTEIANRVNPYAEKAA